MPTYSLHVPDLDDKLDDSDPTPPGLRWCSLWGPHGPCRPSIEGTADEWLLIAGAIEAGASRAFDRVAFQPFADGGRLSSPRNTTGERDQVILTTDELADLAKSIRDQLAPAAADPVRCTTCCDNGYVLGGVGNSPDEQAEDPCPDCGPVARAFTVEPATAAGILAAFGEMAPAPGSRPPGVSTPEPAAPPRVAGWSLQRDGDGQPIVYGPGASVSAWIEDDQLVVEGVSDPESVPVAAVAWLIGEARDTALRALAARWRQGSLDGDDRNADDCAAELDALVAGSR